LKTLVILLGPTGVGKTELSLRLAQWLNTPVISCDSRQFYRELKIGTAAPTAGQLARVPHYFIGHLSVTDHYGAYQFEKDALALLQNLFEKQENALMVGGSMMYIDAVCKGMDEMPSVDETLRQQLLQDFQQQGLDAMTELLQKLDPVYYNEVDLANHKRVLHALEVCLTAGKPYSSFRTNQPQKRPFKILKIGLNRPREELYERINARVDEMMREGLQAEARGQYANKHLNALNTVGYKELFACFDGRYTLDEAVSLIKQNSRRYAKRQLTWFRRDDEIHWFHPDDEENIKAYLTANNINKSNSQ
jgi:tRNA dimethylallyltransferase